jgi:CBS domain-containing membrane protein
MNTKVNDLMVGNVVKVGPHFTIEKTKNLMVSAKLSFVPVVNGEDEILGVVSSKDVIASENPNSPIAKIMSKEIYSIAEYQGIELAAKMMRKHKIHHLLVTKEKKIVGILSSFDLLKLIEGQKFTSKNPGTPKKKRDQDRAPN